MATGEASNREENNCWKRFEWSEKVEEAVSSFDVVGSPARAKATTSKQAEKGQ